MVHRGIDSIFYRIDSIDDQADPIAPGIVGPSDGDGADHGGIEGIRTGITPRILRMNPSSDVGDARVWRTDATADRTPMIANGTVRPPGGIDSIIYRIHLIGEQGASIHGGIAVHSNPVGAIRAGIAGSD